MKINDELLPYVLRVLKGRRVSIGIKGRKYNARGVVEGVEDDVLVLMRKETLFYVPVENIVSLDLVNGEEL